MPKDLKRQGQAHATSTLGRQPASMNGFVNMGQALVRSPVTRIVGRSYPVQFRAQGALDAWRHALENTGIWPFWKDPGTPCWQIRQDILRQLEAHVGDRPGQAPVARDLRAGQGRAGR